MSKGQARKNANGQGTTRWNADRQRYEHRLTTGTKADGTPIRRMVTAKTQAELDAKIRALSEATTVNPHATVGMTVAQWVDMWLTDILPLERSSQVSKDHYADRARLYVLPFIGSVPLANLEPAHIRKMITGIRAKGLSGTTQHAGYKTIHRILNVAMAEGLVTRNVAALVDAPNRDIKKGRSLEFEESKRLLSYLQTNEHEAPIATLLMLGMRPGELGGLTWDDIDLNNGHMWIRRTLHKPVKGRPAYVTDDVAKTDRSIRGIPMPSYIVDVLKRHRAKQLAERLAYGPEWGMDFPDHDFVFTREGGLPINLDTLRARVQTATETCGLGKWNPYQMRHSAISLMAALGYSSKMISEIVGNSPAIAEAVYMHTFEPAKREAVDAYSAAIAPAR